MFVADIRIDEDENTVFFVSVKARTLWRVKRKAFAAASKRIKKLSDNLFGTVVNITISNEKNEYVDCEEIIGSVKDGIFIMEV